ncbi:MAG TPA: PTS system mannose/fructose/sorbose family transporter subunit IID [Feifaniaceae bacterium]|nr:PTS system mannose/fructose/sorbose family transporter subunit IID [Feifaniaceae bacterium]
MTLFQAFLIAVFGYLSSIYSPWLALGGWYTLGRPLIAGFVIGIILGDIPTGILMGAAVQAVFIGLITPGGSMPGDANLAAYIGIPLAMVSGLDTTFAVSMSVVLSFVGVLAVLLVVTVNCLFVHRMDRLIDHDQLDKAARTPIVGQITNFIVRFFPILLACYFGQDFTTRIANSLPIAVVGIFGMFGTLLPLVGFSILLCYIVKKKTDLLYYICGFILAKALNLPILPIVAIASVFAFMDIKYTPSATQEEPAPVPEETLEKKRLLSKKDVRRCYWSWMLWNLSAQNMERMEAPAIVRMLSIVREKLYPGDAEKQKQLLSRHTPFFNTEPYVGCIVPGIVLGMEEESAIGGELPGEMITGIKTAMMGPFAGIGDSLYVGTLIPILLGIALGLSGTTGSMAGPVFYIVAHLAIMFPVTWLLFSRGYKTGISSVQQILGGGVKDRITKALSIVGLTVAGAITATSVNLQTGWVYTSGEMTIDLNTIFNGLFPGLMTLVFALLTFWLMYKKKVALGWMFLIYFGLAVVGLVTKLFTIG